MQALELAIHSSVVLFGLLHLLWHGFTYSLQFEVGGKWDGYAPGLRPGWLFGRRVDLSDDQWRDFRSNLPLLLTALALFAAASQAVKRAVRCKTHHVAAFYVTVAAGFLIFLHGACAFFVFALVIANYQVARSVAGSEYGGFIIWAFNLTALFVVRLNDGFRFSGLSPHLAWLDTHRGSLRWHICFNITVLRMLSYALDLHWARKQRATKLSSPTVHAHKNTDTKSNAASALAVSTPRERQRTPLPSDTEDYGFLLCLAHALYPSLYIAGPVITYQDFVWQLKQQETVHSLVKPHSSTLSSSSSPEASSLVKATAASTVTHSVQVGAAAAAVPQTVSWSQCLKYAARLAADLVCIELVTHFLYFNSIAKYRIGFKYKDYGLPYTAQEMGLTGWWVLSFMWLKFAVIWRTFRFAALLEGLEPPENMVRCFANNYDVEGFWRGWHSSYNRWLVRYLYIPIGGSNRKLLAVWLTFLFVAIWHDLEWHLIGWAALICLAFVPEILLKRFAATSPALAPYNSTAMYRHMCAACAAVNIAALMAANLTGFVVGLDGLGQLLSGLMASPVYVSAALTCFYCAAQLMFMLREHGITKL